MSYILFDALGENFQVGDVVNVPCVVVSVAASPAPPSACQVNLTALYSDPDGSTFEAIQVYATTVTKNK